MTDSSTVYAVSKSDFQLAGKMELGKSTLKRNEREHSWTPFHFSIWKWMNKKSRTWQVNFETEWNENLWTQIHFYFPSWKWMKKKSGIWQIKFEEKVKGTFVDIISLFCPVLLLHVAKAVLTNQLAIWWLQGWIHGLKDALVSGPVLDGTERPNVVNGQIIVFRLRKSS